MGFGVNQDCHGLEQRNAEHVASVSSVRGRNKGVVRVRLLFLFMLLTPRRSGSGQPPLAVDGAWRRLPFV
jgi:hypothetical protein